MQKLVIIGANEFQQPLIQRANALGYETHVFAWADGAVAAKDAAFFYPISITEKEEIYKICEEIEPAGVLTAGSDLATVTVSYLAEKMDLKANSMKCVSVATNKYEMRKAFRQAGVPTPLFCEVDDNTDLSELQNLSFPVIVKPTDRSGSRGITKVENATDLQSAIKKAVDNSFEKKAIVEEYIDGDEYSCESISFQGEHTVLAITKKFTTGSPNFIETGHLQPAGLSEALTHEVKQQVVKALDALYVEYGASHAEFKITSSGQVRIIEIGARMGGDCIGSHLVELSTGYDYLKMIIDVAVGNKPEINNQIHQKYAAIRFIFNQEDLDLFNHYKDTALMKLQSEVIQLVDHEITDSSSRYGFFIVSSEQYDEIKDVLPV